MNRYPQHPRQGIAEPSREDFADGSAVVTYPDGSLLIVETKTAQVSTLREGGPVNYNEPPPAKATKRRERENYAKMLRARTPDAWNKQPPMVSVPSIGRTPATE